MGKVIEREAAPAGALDGDLLGKFRSDFESDSKNRLAMNAVCVSPIGRVAMNRRTVAERDLSFSHHLPENKATAQNSSGRCWLFAALNVLRVRAIDTMKLGDDWELSQNYPLFWDKLEKSNYFLESILETLDEPTDGRLISFLVQNPIQDGGQWHMFVNLVRKYGLVPKSVMPETDSSSATAPMNRFITAKLREYAAKLRRMHRAGKPVSALRKSKEEFMNEVYRMLVIHLGEPPREFHWQWRDKDRGFHREGEMTPLGFYEKFVDVDLEDYVCLIHCPQEAKEMNQIYTIKFLGNVVGGELIKYVNVELDVMKRAAIEQIKNGEPVWFGCDVGQYLDRELGILDLGLFDYETVYGTRLQLDKAERLDYGQSQMTHAMVFTGVDLDENDSPRRWRVENSWGEKAGDKGFLVMSDDWFDEYNYEVAVHKKYVPSEILSLLDRKPIELDPWDPMGALAR